MERDFDAARNLDFVGALEWTKKMKELSFWLVDRRLDLRWYRYILGTAMKRMRGR